MEVKGLKNSSSKCDPSVLIVIGLGVGEGEFSSNPTDVRLVH
jgi:hypothetical protein